MIAYIIIIIGIWALNAFTLNDSHTRLKTALGIAEVVLLFIAVKWPLIIVVFPVYWILKDAFINFFQLNQKGWGILLYGGNNKGDTLSKYMWKLFDLFEGRDWLKEHWYISDEFVKEHQESFNKFHFKVKIITLIIATIIYLI